MSKTKRGTPLDNMRDELMECPKCGMRVHVHKDGTLYAHGKLQDYGQEPIWCEMSDKPAYPLEVE